MIAPGNSSSSKATAHEVDRYVTVTGARLRYRDEGHGPAVILVHGWTLDLEMWEPQVAALRDEFRLVRFDRRGYGLSQGHPSSEKDPTDIAALCTHLGLDRVALVGMSQGARSVLRFASDYASRVSAVILDGPPVIGGAAVDSELPMAHFRDIAQARGLDAFREEWRSHAFMQVRNGNPLAQKLVDRMLQRYPGNDLIAHTSAESSNTPVRLNSVLAPTLVLSGEHDLASRVQTAKRLSMELPSAVHAVIAEAGHLINLDQTGRYNEMCRSFLIQHTNIPA